MAASIETFDFASSVSGRSAYPWAQWLNGKVWKLDKEDVLCKNITFLSNARTKCYNLGIKLRTGKADDGCLVIQAYDFENKEANLARKASKDAANKANREANPTEAAADEVVNEAQQIANEEGLNDHAIIKEGPKVEKSKGKGKGKKATAAV